MANQQGSDRMIEDWLEFMQFSISCVSNSHAYDSEMKEV